jgi:hypothetical protein
MLGIESKKTFIVSNGNPDAAMFNSFLFYQTESESPNKQLKERRKKKKKKRSDLQFWRQTQESVKVQIFGIFDQNSRS